MKRTKKKNLKKKNYLSSKKFPSKVKIGSFWFDIIQISKSDDKINTTTYSGCIYPNDLKIYIKSEAKQEAKYEVLLHEVIHRLSSTLTLNLEEDQVTRLSYALYDFLSDNRGIFMKEVK